LITRKVSVHIFLTKVRNTIWIFLILNSKTSKYMENLEVQIVHKMAKEVFVIDM